MGHTDINGIFGAASLRALCWPIAWAGTVDAETRAAHERALRELRDEGLELLRTIDGAEAVEIVDGAIVAVTV